MGQLQRAPAMTRCHSLGMRDLMKANLVSAPGGRTAASHGWSASSTARCSRVAGKDHPAGNRNQGDGKHDAAGQGRCDDGSVTADRDRLRATFDSAAHLYQQSRPDYPEELYDELVRLADLRSGDRLLEIGCATGKATAPLAWRGFRITCVELGAGLAAAARRNLARFPDVEVVEAAFETWRPPRGTAFDLVFAATAWHWIDPAVKYQRAWELLRPGGHLALWAAAHVFPAGGDTFFREIQHLYDEIGARRPPGAAWPRPGELPDSAAEIVGTGLFERVSVRHFDWEVSYSAEEYVRLLDTFSDHIAMDARKRGRLDSEIRRLLGDRRDGRVRRHWGAVLHVARSRADPEPPG
jgi:SAM-dependent methyltransferase